jgi:putative tryptophan/tyrosine transport system substrate-binding protein
VIVRRFLVMLGLALVFGPAMAFAQGGKTSWRLGILTPAIAPLEAICTLTLPELANEGFIEGQNLAVETRLGSTEDLPRLARELANTAPDAVMAVGSGAIRAMLNASDRTPIVGAFIGEDPIAAGYAQSLAHPGGSVTGILMLAPELDAKRLNLLHEAFPSVSHVAALAANATRDTPNITAMEEQAKQAGFSLTPFYAGAPEAFPATFGAMKAAGIEALAISSAPELASNAERLAALAIEVHLPTMCEWPCMAQQGCFMAYGPVFAALHRRNADYVARIFRGARPGDLPIEQPTHFGFAINTKTAKALGIEVPASLLARADQVIE